jgi:predicted DCC family thiol-disulfide oxidoreductase YuxK
VTTTEALNKPAIFFDGYCNLCNSSVRFIIKRDKKNQFQFSSLQSELGQTILRENNLPDTNFNTLLLVKNGKVYTFSTAALTIAKELSGLWPLFYAAIIIPEKIRNVVYNYIAKNRYIWFGKKEQCDLYPLEMQKRIIQ